MMTIEFNTSNNEGIILQLDKLSQTDNKIIFNLIDEFRVIWGKLEVKNNSIKLIDKKDEIIDSDDLIESKLDELLFKIIESEDSGTDSYSDADSLAINPYNPDDIKVRSDKMSITLIHQMIGNGDIDLNPDFQRNLVWDSKQKSRLIESILLRIPLPMFYFAEDKEGKLIVVDGLQRISTIRDFMDNKFPLKGLQYLGSSCDGRYYESNGKKAGIDAKYFRWFNLTTISVNIIDPTSPAKVKYDIFRRINTGGRSLNNQEIRNCLTRENLRTTLQMMTQADHFKIATDESVKSKRMDDHEIALRFMLFYEMYKDNGNINSYSGYMESSLDDFAERYSKAGKEELKIFVNKFNNAMQNAYYLMGGKYAFRKIRPKDLEPNGYKQLINKALFVCQSVLLADYEPNRIKLLNTEGALLLPITNEIDKDADLYNYLSYGTNGWKNITQTFDKLQELFNQYIKY